MPYESKPAFIRTMPDTMPVSSIIERGKKHKLEITAQDVYATRAAVAQRRARGPGKKIRKANGSNGHSPAHANGRSELVQQFRKIALRLGLDRAGTELTQLEKNFA